MAALLAKFRIDYSDVIVIPDITKKAQESTKKEFEALIEPFKADVCEDGSAITEVELMGLREKTNRHLRLRELLQDHSKDSTFVVM
jgi:solute carrier family 12 sodium/potassium/chloride transporter 2